MLRISDVIELAMVSRKTIYNAINSGRLKYQLVNVDNRQVRMFLEEDVFEAFPKTSRSIKFSASSAPFFISPPARTSLIYIYSCLSRRYSYHTMETTTDIFSPCPDIRCPDVYFFQFFSIL